MKASSLKVFLKRFLVDVYFSTRSKIIQFLFFSLALILTVEGNALAVAHKGLSFQALIKMPSGERPSEDNVDVNAKIMSPNDCILRDETFKVKILEGTLAIALGSGTPTVSDKGLSLPQIMDNSKTIEGLSCVKVDGRAVLDSGNNPVTSFNPQEHPAGHRKVRITFEIQGWPVSAEFTIRAVGFAINAETLSGKTQDEFVQISSHVTQSRLEEFLEKITAAANQSIKWDGENFVSYNPNQIAGESISTGMVEYARLPVGTTNDTVAAGDDARFTDARNPVGDAGGDLSGSYPSPTVTKIQRQSVSATAPATGQVLRWNGSAYEPFYLGVGNLQSSAGVLQFASASCAPSQTLAWSSVSDTFSCIEIAGLNASVITDGTIDGARLPASATAWRDGGAGIIYYNSGNVGIGTSSPVTTLDVNGAYV